MDNCEAAIPGRLDRTFEILNRKFIAPKKTVHLTTEFSFEQSSADSSLASS